MCFTCCVNTSLSLVHSLLPGIAQSSWTERITLGLLLSSSNGYRVHLRTDRLIYAGSSSRGHPTYSSCQIGGKVISCHAWYSGIPGMLSDLLTRIESFVFGYAGNASIAYSIVQAPGGRKCQFSRGSGKPGKLTLWANCQGGTNIEQQSTWIGNPFVQEPLPAFAPVLLSEIMPYVCCCLLNVGNSSWSLFDKWFQYGPEIGAYSTFGVWVLHV